MSGIATAIVGSAVVGGYVSSRNTDQAADAAAAANDTQYALGMEQIQFGRDQWALWKNKILPMEMEASRLGISAQELALKRGKDDYQLYSKFYKPLAQKVVTEAQKAPDYARYARLARQDVNQAFDTAQGSMKRDLFRHGVSPTDGAYRNLVGDMSLRRAAVTSDAVTKSRDRAEDIAWNKKIQAMGGTPSSVAPGQGINSSLSPSSAAYSMGQGGNTMSNVASNQLGMAQMYANNASGAVQGGINLGMQAYDLYSRFNPTSAASSTFTPTSTNGVNAVSMPSNASTWGYQPTAFAEGGPVETPRLVRGYEGGGMVSGPPGIDQVPAVIHGNDGRQYPAALTHGEYVLPKPVVDNVGRDWLDDFVEKHQSNEPRTTGARLRRGG